MDLVQSQFVYTLKLGNSLKFNKCKLNCDWSSKIDFENKLV